MCNRKKFTWRSVPALIIAGGLATGAALKIVGAHPMATHFAEMGLQPYLTAIGFVEFICILLFLFPKTIKIGLLLLTGYFGGAMAAEIPYNMMFAPAVVLLLVWTAAFIRMPQLFLERESKSFTTPES